MSPRPRAAGAGALLRLGRSLVAAALCAQLTHAVLHGSLLPAAGAHGYLVWYVPLLAGLSVAALVAAPASIAAGARAGGRRSFGAILPERRQDRVARDVVRLALTSGALLLSQESLERSAEAGGLRLATFAPVTWAVLVLVLSSVAAAIVAVERTLEDLAGRLVAPVRPRSTLSAGWTRKACSVVSPRPLAVHGGLRAPPVTT